MLGPHVRTLLTKIQLRRRMKAKDEIDDVKKAVVGSGLYAAEVLGSPRDVPSEFRVEVTTTGTRSATSVDGLDPLTNWKKDPDTPVNMRLLPSVPQVPQPSTRPRGSSSIHPRLSGSEERRHHRDGPGHSQSRSRTSSPIDQSSHHSRRSVDLSSSGIHPQRQKRSSEHHTDPASPASPEGADSAVIDRRLESDSMSEIISHAGDGFPDADGVENTSYRPETIDPSLVLPTRLTNGSSSTGSTYVRSLDNSTNASTGTASIEGLL